MRTYPHRLMTAIEELSKWRSDSKVLSAFVDVSPAARAQGNAIVAFRDASRDLLASLPDSERQAFTRAATRVEALLAADRMPAAPGLALFIAGTGGLIQEVELPMVPEPGMTWSNAPRLEPLEEALDDYERVAVVLFDKERARVFTIYLGQVEERVEFVDEVPGKQASGEWFALAQARYARHHEDHVLRHARRATRTLMAFHRKRPYDRLFLAGPAEALAVLRHHLPGVLRTRVAGELKLELFASEDEVLKAALSQAEHVERADELEEVRTLLEDVSSPHPALGVDSTLEAVSDDRVHRLLVADSFHPAGYECPSCGFLAQTGGACGRCGAETTAVADLGEALVERSRLEGATVEVVAGEAAERLIAAGGVAAWTRF